MIKIATIGNFDGIHIGHQLLINRVIELAKSNRKAKLYTFNFLTKEKIKEIFPFEEKIKLLKNYDIDEIEVLDFNTIKNLTAEKFLEKLYKDGVRYLVVGEDFRFGKNRSGSVKTLEDLGKKYDIEIEVIKSLMIDNEKVSSTLIRELLINGEVKKANKLLNKNFYIKSKVVHGYQRGTKIGFNTANTIWQSDIVRVKNGVYHTRVTYNDKTYDAMTMVGIPYTFTDNEFSVETHIFNFNEDIYDKEIKIEFIDYLRENKKFKNQLELKSQLEKDKSIILENKV